MSSTLNILLRQKKWTESIERVKRYPQEASIQNHVTFRCGTKVQCFPVHIACMRKPPLALILTLIAADAETMKKKDGLGRLPLHNAIRYGADLKVVNIAISVYPQGVYVSADDGSLPIHLASLYGDFRTMPVIQSLLRAYPESIHKSDCHGLLPKDSAMDNPHLAKDSISELLIHAETACIKSNVENNAKDEIGWLKECCKDGENDSFAEFEIRIGAHLETLAKDDDSTRGHNTRLNVKDAYENNFNSSSASNSNSGSKTKMCVVCMERDVSHVLIPCGHLCLCSVCSVGNVLDRMNRRCPECRSTISKVMKVFGRIVDDE